MTWKTSKTLVRGEKVDSSYSTRSPSLPRINARRDVLEDASGSSPPLQPPRSLRAMLSEDDDVPVYAACGSGDSSSAPLPDAFGPGEPGFDGPLHATSRSLGRAVVLLRLDESMAGPPQPGRGKLCNPFDDVCLRLRPAFIMSSCEHPGRHRSRKEKGMNCGCIRND